MENVQNAEGLDMDFDGVFRFTNPDDEDFVKLWNSVEYTFPPKSRSPMIIRGSTPEEIQEIRKKFAYALAEKMWFKSARYKELNALPNFRGGRDDKELEILIEACLSPLPTAKAKVEVKPIKELNLKASKAVGGNDSLNEVFKDETKDENIRKLGKMSESAI